MITNARYYAEQRGFAVMPVHGINLETKKCTCGKEACNLPDHRGKRQAGKHPWTLHGLKNASSDPVMIEVLWKLKQYSNIGIVTGPISGIFVLDVDGMEGESSLANYPALPATLTSYTGNGRHIIFRYPDRKVFTRAGKFAPGLDIRGEGGYIVAPPSVHANGAVYQWIDATAPIADAPEWLLEIVCREKTFTPHVPSSQPLDEWAVDDVREMLSFLDPDCGYEDWINIGMALHNEGHPLAIWDEWSRRGQKYKQGSTITHWKSFHSGGGITFGTLVHMAALSGWKPKEIDGPMNLDDHPAREFLIKIGAYTPPTSPPTTSFLIDPLKIPGLVGDTIRAIVETAQKPQPELAMLNTLAALGAVFGRRYASPMDTRTNLYTVGIAVTAAGKDHSRRFIKRLMIEAGLEAYLGADAIVSGAGTLTALEKQPAQIMHLDEFGMLLEAITDQRGAHYMKAASKVITEAYSTSSATLLGGQYGDGKIAPKKIAAPNLCIYGTTTPEKYVSALNKSVVHSGELNRFIVMRPSIDRPERRRYMGNAAPPETIVQAWAALAPSPILNNALIVPELIHVSWAGLDDRIWEMGLYEDNQIKEYEAVGALWGRYRENVIKIAMILSIVRNPLVPRMQGDDLDVGEAILRQAINYVMSLANENMADSEHEKDCNEIIAVIKGNGGRVKLTVLCRNTRRMDTKQRDNAIRSLIEQDKVFTEKDVSDNSIGRKSTFLVLSHKAGSGKN